MHCRLEPYDVIRVGRDQGGSSGFRGRWSGRIASCCTGTPCSLGQTIQRFSSGPIEPSYVYSRAGRMRQTFNVGQDSHIGPLVSLLIATDGPDA
jgi:hypothetical protein